MNPSSRAAAALVSARKAAETGDVLAAEVAKDDAHRALEESSAWSADIIVARPGSQEASEARLVTDRVGAIYGQVCMAHCRARVVSRLRRK